MDSEMIHFIQNEKNIAMEFVEDTRAWLQGGRDRRVYCYGAGFHAQYVLRFMKKYGIPIQAILDSNREGEYNQIPVIRYDSFLKDSHNPDSCRFVISAPSAATEIISTLEMSFPPEIIYNFETCLYLSCVDNVDAYREYLLRHVDQISEFSTALQDVTSRQTLKNVLKGRISGNIAYFTECYAPDQYYPRDIIFFQNDEVLLELGANDGATLRELFAHCPDYKAAYCFEAEKDYQSKLEKLRLEQERKGKTLYVINKGAWSSCTSLKFLRDVSGGGGSFVQGENGLESVNYETETIDHAVTDQITYMKMDIEGSEMEALRGAHDQIQKNKPKLAVCVYHKIEDIPEIWNYLRALVPDYRFFLRHHGQYCAAETVLYAIP